VPRTATNLVYPLDAFSWVRGESQVADFPLPDARYFATAFCRRCGSDVARVSTERQLVVVPAGSLDDDPGARPEQHIFTGSKHRGSVSPTRCRSASRGRRRAEKVPDGASLLGRVVDCLPALTMRLLRRFAYAAVTMRQQQ
jgi:hypothetical protein